MKIAQIAPAWFPVPPLGYGGIELIVSLLSDGLVDRGHEVTLYAAKGSTTKAKLVTPLDEPPDPSQLGDVWFDTMHCLISYLDIQVSEFDIIHDHSGIIGPAMGVLNRDRGNRPVLAHTLHGPWTEQGKRFYGLIDDLISLIAISNTQMEDNPKVHYQGMVYNGIELSDYRFESKKQDYLVYIGRANPDKGPVTALEVAHRAGLDLKMVIKRNEPAEREYFDQEIAPLVNNQVEVFENIPHSQKVELLANAMAMIFPIQWPEPFGLVMAEAMACGTPVIAGKWGAAKELVVDGETGFLCNSMEEYLRALDSVSKLDPARCRKWTQEQFSASIMVSRYEQVFESLLNR